MNDRQLRYALAVRDELSFSRAAENLIVSQPSISEQVGVLERELGFPLFRRTGRGIEITESGQVFLNQAQEVMEGHCHVNQRPPQGTASRSFQAAALALSHTLNASARSRLNVSLLSKWRWT